MAFPEFLKDCRNINESQKNGSLSIEVDDESDTLSDIDDFEVDWCLNTEEEKRYKKIIWEEMNREYLEEQCGKKAAAAATKEASSASFQKKGRQQNQAQKVKSAHAAEEETLQTNRKRLSSRINYNNLKLSEEPLAFESPKKMRTESGTSDHVDTEKSQDEANKVDEVESVEDDDRGGDYENTLYGEYDDEAYNCDDYGYDGF